MAPHATPSGAMSPGARLLRSSRMFSIPKPLPDPTFLATATKRSDTMTRPYPQYQAITSPLPSREKGDWGFKRPFPLKTTMTSSTPLIRVKKVDCVENVTDFSSAADHTLSLEKFQELRMAFSVPRPPDAKESRFKFSNWLASVFEEDRDFTYWKPDQSESGLTAQDKAKFAELDRAANPDAWLTDTLGHAASTGDGKPYESRANRRRRIANRKRDLYLDWSPMVQLRGGQDPADMINTIYQDHEVLEKEIWSASQEEAALLPETEVVGLADQPVSDPFDGESYPATDMTFDLTSIYDEELHRESSMTLSSPSSPSGFADRSSDLQRCRWKFKGPWLNSMPRGEFHEYVAKEVRSKRSKFQAMLKKRLAQELTTTRSTEALQQGLPPPAPVRPKDITSEQFLKYLSKLRFDHNLLYEMIDKFLDMAPMGHPLPDQISALRSRGENPYGKLGPPPSHPSAGLSYLRTSSFMENHPVYGPQAHRAPAVARVVMPRNVGLPARLGVGGFVADVPSGDNEFSGRFGGRYNTPSAPKTGVPGIFNLDLVTWGGAKAFVEPHTATVDSNGNVVLQLRESSAEAQLIHKERSDGSASIYNDKPLARFVPGETPVEDAQRPPPPRLKVRSGFEVSRDADDIMNQIFPRRAREQEGDASDVGGQDETLR